MSSQMEPIQAARSRATSLENTLNSLRTKASLGEVFDDLEDVDSQVNALAPRLMQVRTRGYVFKSGLETELSALQSEWPSARVRVQLDAERQRPFLVTQADRLYSDFVSARGRIESDSDNGMGALGAVDSSAQALQRSVDAVLSSLRGMYDSTKGRISKVQADIQKIEQTLRHIDEATFKLFPDEHVIDAIEGQWMQDEKNGPKGVLLCTDHRLLFEQKEEIATKKVLFITTQKQKVQQLALEAPIGSVKEVKESESGALIFRKDHLDLTFGPDAKVRSAHFILKGDSALWQQLINRVGAGDIERERIESARPEAAAAPKAAPTQCPACGARITQEIVRGMKSMKCQFCGTVIRL